MKKTTIILIVILTCNSHIKSQSKWKIAFKAGPNIANIKSEYFRGTSKYGLGFSTGFDFYRFEKKHLFFKTGVNYNLKTFKYSSFDYYLDTTRNGKSLTSHLTVPILWGYKFNIKKQTFYISAGLEIDYLFYTIQKSDLYGTRKFASKDIDYLAPKYLLGVAYLNKINEKYTLFINPEYSGNIDIGDILDNDYIISWRMNLGIIYKF